MAHRRVPGVPRDRALLFGETTLTGSIEAIGVDEPLLRRADRHELPSLEPGDRWRCSWDLRRVGRLAGRPVPAVAGVERQQIKWVVFGLAGRPRRASCRRELHRRDRRSVTPLISGTAFLLVPVSIGVAVLRYHLYDLDVVVRKTLVYARARAVRHAASTRAWWWASGPGSDATTRSSRWSRPSWSRSTFQPVRARLTRFANRLVYGRRATPYEVLSEFSERVGGAYADEDVLPRMARVLGEGIGAERADVWLAGRRRARATSRRGPPTPVAPADRRWRTARCPTIAGVDARVPGRAAGELLGALAVRKPASDPIDAGRREARRRPRRRRRGSCCGTSADRGAPGAARRAEGRAEAARRGAGRGAPPARAQHPRRRAAAARRARRQAAARADARRARPREGAAMLEQLAGRDAAALEDLRDLARGIYPPLLADKGLAAALEAQARKVAAAGRDLAPTASAGTRRTSRPPCTSRAWRRCRTSRSTPEASASSIALVDAATASRVRGDRRRRGFDRRRRLRHRAAGDRRPLAALDGRSR